MLTKEAPFKKRHTHLKVIVEFVELVGIKTAHNYRLILESNICSVGCGSEKIKVFSLIINTLMWRSALE